jgi:hypothetical protein
VQGSFLFFITAASMAQGEVFCEASRDRRARSAPIAEEGPGVLLGQGIGRMDVPVTGQAKPGIISSAVDKSCLLGAEITEHLHHI